MSLYLNQQFKQDEFSSHVSETVIPKFQANWPILIDGFYQNSDIEFQGDF